MIYSLHSQARFRQRFSHKLVKGQSDELTMHQLFLDSNENRSIANNTKYMVHMLEKYGDCDCKFYENKDLIFVVRGTMVVTLLQKGDSGTFRIANPKTYRKTRA